MYPVGKVMFLDKLFDAEGTSCKRPERCISCGVEINIFVTHHTQVFEGVCIGELRAVIKKEVADCQW